jgi:flavin reductase (DIM6/NTAB) family NADH-FMN oxidoreductase RutF
LDLEYGTLETRKFVTNIGLVSSKGKYGYNIMSAEWARIVSYSPGYIMLNLHSFTSTAENIIETGEFGVGIAGEDQGLAARFAGHYSGREYDKIAMLQAMGYKFHRAANIDVLMISGSAMEVECKLKESKELGDHLMFIGSVVGKGAVEGMNPLVYHSGKMYKLGDVLHEPWETYVELAKGFKRG